MDVDEFLEDFIVPSVATPVAFAAEFAEWLADGADPAAERWLAAMHLSTSRHAAISLLVSAMTSDYEDVVVSLGAAIPFAAVIRRDWLEEAAPWLAANTPGAVVWDMPSHLGFWTEPAAFNARLVAFLEDADRATDR
jgi:hypothetical protein